MRDAVIVSAVRTPTGKFLGALKDFTRARARRAGRRAKRCAAPASTRRIVDECIMGNVVAAGLGQNPARQAALNGGLADHVAALTINKVCGSGLKAVMLAAQGIATGDIDVAVAGGMESMSNCPYLLPRVREGLRMGNGAARRLDDQRRPVVRVRAVPHGQCRARSSPSTTTSAARRRTRTPRESHRKAARGDATQGWFADEILPIAIPQKKGAAARRRSRRSRSAPTPPSRRSAR